MKTLLCLSICALCLLGTRRRSTVITQLRRALPPIGRPGIEDHIHRTISSQLDNFRSVLPAGETRWVYSIDLRQFGYAITITWMMEIRFEHQLRSGANPLHVNIRCTEDNASFAHTEVRAWLLDSLLPNLPRLNLLNIAIHVICDDWMEEAIATNHLTHV